MKNNPVKDINEEIRLHVMDSLFEQFHKAISDLNFFSEKDNYSVMFSSCNKGEGTSTISLNFALAFAIESKKKVLLIDGNLRNPALHNFFGVDKEKGLAELIKGEIDFGEAIREIKPQGISFISAGKQISDPFVLYKSENFQNILNELKRLFDFIIFDSSPIIPFPESIIVSSILDGLIMVLEAEITRWEVSQTAKDYLMKANTRVLGAILNKKKYYIPKRIYNLL